MNLNTKILGIMFAFGFLTVGLVPTLSNLAGAVDIDLSDYKCIAAVGINNCNEDNSITQETTNNDITNNDDSTTNNITCTNTVGTSDTLDTSTLVQAIGQTITCVDGTATTSASASN